jgi:hypothetical protein
VYFVRDLELFWSSPTVTRKLSVSLYVFRAPLQQRCQSQTRKFPDMPIHWSRFIKGQPMGNAQVTLGDNPAPVAGICL